MKVGNTELKNRVHTKINFIQYLGQTKTVQHYLQQNDRQLSKNCDIKYLNTIEIFCRSKKGSRDMYNILLLKKKKYIQPLSNGLRIARKTEHIIDLCFEIKQALINNL